MKKRILSILLLCCMVLGLLPTTVFANNDGTKAIQLGTSGISGYDSTNNSYDYIYFGTWDNSTVKWRVLDTKTNMPNAQEGDGFFLLSDALLGTGEFGGVEFDYTTPYTNDWRGSRAQDWCNGFYNRNLSTTEQKAVFATSKSDDPYIDGYFMGSENILNGDKVFFLSAEEVRKAAYGFIDDNARIANYGDSAGGWWLRSPHRDYNAAGVVNASGGVRAEWVNDTNAARPAFNLKPDSVLLVSAAVGGKGAADGIFKIPEYSGDEWKLTLLDDTRAFRVTETAAVGKPGGSVTLNFSGARTGQNEYISAIIKGESGATHYGRIMKPTAADTQLSFTLPYDLDSGNYKLYVFSEQCNGDYKTDYASRFQAVALTVEEAANEQFDLVPGGRYYFDLSAMGIPGTANGSLPDASLHYVPFTYTGIVDAYTLTSEMTATDAYAEKYKYPHSLFVADFAVTHTVNWNALNDASLIFGKGYAAGGVEYTLRAPSVGSDVTAGSDDLECGTPQSNEWDRMLDKNNGYIKNWSGMSSWGQDTPSTEASSRAVRGCDSARGWHNRIAATSDSSVGFRPVLEVLNPDMLGSDGLKAVVLDLGGGKLGNRSENIQIIVKSGESFTAPGGDGLTRPDGNTGSYFMWLGSDGELYDPGDSVPAVVNKLTARFAPIEQFSLVPGGTYYFDLSGTGIRGTAHSRLPDKTLHYVPFTYAGTVDAYKLTSAMATTVAYAQQNKYAHSLFVADYAITHTVSWENLNSAGLIFGKDYTFGGVEYTLRAPSVGSSGVGSNYSQHGIPQGNEWDKMLDKDNGYIKNFRQIYSFGQDTTSSSESGRASRGYNAPRIWHRTDTTRSNEALGFRPVLEVLNPDMLGSDGLKVVVLDLGGGTLGSGRLSVSSDIQIIVKNGESFTAPASNGLTRPDGNTGSYFMWRGSDGALYAPGDSVPANVNKLTAQFDSIEQFTLVPGGTYYFDLSGAGIPGTANGSLPDASLHYVPFTYAGTVDAYALTSEMATTDDYAEKHKYPHSLFVADFAVTHTISWKDLNSAGLIFGKNYTADSVEYTMRVPSAGRSYRGSGDSVRGNPQSNEWDKILDKYDGYIRNCNATYSWGQDVAHNWAQGRAMRGYSSVRNWNFTNASDSGSYLGFRPILEVLNPDTLKPNGLKAVALDLGGGKLGGSSDNIQIIVKNGSEFTAPASDGLTRPDGDTGSYFMWFGSDGNLYAPGESISADVTKLMAQFEPGVYTVTITTDRLPDGKVGKAYSQTLIATGTVPITWSIDSGNLPAGLSLNKDSGEISGTPTADGTAKFTVKAGNSVGSDTKELSITITKDAPAEFTITVKTDGNGTGTATPSTAAAGTEITLTATPNKGYHFKEWEVISGGVTIENNKFLMPNDNVEVKAIFEKDAPPAPTEFTITVKTDGNGTASASHAKAVAGTEITLTATPNEGYRFKEWQVIRGGVAIKDDKFLMPNDNVEVKAIFEEDAPPVPTEFTITVKTDGNGTASASPDKAVAGTEIRLTATPKEGYHFKEWQAISGNVTIKDNKFTMPDGNVEVKAIFEKDAPPAPTEYTVTVTNDGNGTASASPAKAVAGAEITLTAMPNEGYYFKEWQVISGGVSIKNNKFTMPNNNVEVKAIFEEDTPPAPTEHTVTVTSGGNGTASASPAKAVAGAEITLSATPDKGYHLKEWQVISGGVSIKDNKFLMPDSNVEVKAIFEEDAPPAPTEHTVTVTSSGNGTASASPSKAVAGAEITLSATPDKGYHLKEWQVISGGVSIKDNKFLMPDSNVEVKAIFEEDAPPAPTEHTVTVTSSGNGTASASPAKAVAGAEITLSATPDKGYHLKEWQVISGGVSIKDNKFTMPDSEVEIKAIFEEDAPPVPTDPAKPNISVTGTYTYNGSVHTATVSGYDPTTMDISGNTATDAGDYTVRVTSKTGKWADGSTGAVTAAWSIGKATQEAPDGLIGVAPTTEGGSDGKISGVTDKMEYRMADGSIYTACSGTEIENLSAGNYFVRYAEDNNHFAGPDVAVTVGEGAPLADCTITFNGNGGSGSMEPVTVKAETNYILPECGFTAPADQEFKAWEIGGTEYKVGDSYTVNGDIEIKALWKNSVITPSTYTVTVSNDGNGTGAATPSTAAAGTTIILTAMPKEGYHFKEWQVIRGGVTIKNNKFTMPDNNVEVKAIFEEDTPPAPTEHTVTVTSGGNGTASASPAKAVAGAEITLSATPDKGYHLKEWQVESPAGLVITNNKFTMPDTNVAIKAIFEEDAPPAPTEFTITVKTDGNGTASSSHAKAVVGTEITLTAKPNKGYHFKEWEVISGGVTIKNNKFTMPDNNVEVKAIFEEDVPALQYKDADKTTPAPAATATPAPAATATTQYTIPQTGDTSNPALLVVLMLVSGSAAIGTAVVASKKKHNR
ncbi:InlB B-repeat-containing protein [Gemmiger formicilis]|uniref:InlB B-repeat-containing protein n=1 Tax=Gemmiger formicilis TaxID=745368 RepID=UPI0035223682